LTADRPRFSIVSAVYNVEPYLPEFIASIEAQSLDPASVEVIAVNDGSTDGSLPLLEAWRERGRVPVTIVSQANAGQGAARNTGLERARGEWVTFTDPDDMLEPRYLAAADAFARAHPGIDILSGKRLRLDEARGEIRDAHPRRWQFAAGTRVADLDHEPNVFPVSATTAFFRGDRLRETGLRYDAELRPHFEDQHFAARFLLELERPLVGLVADARYVYRVRLANDSTLQRIHLDERSYTTVFERGYLDLVRRSRDRSGLVAPWIQQLILYELTRRYFREAEAYPSQLSIPESLAGRFHDLFGELARSLDETQVYGHAASRLEGIWAEVLVHGYRDGPWVPNRADRTDVDRVMRLQRIAFRYRGDAPVARLELGGRAVEPAFTKTRAVAYFGRTQLRERILWAPLVKGLRLSLDGADVAIAAPSAPERALDAPHAAAHGTSWWAGLRGRVGRGRTVASITRLLARTVYRRPFGGAWVITDGVNQAGGDGERLFVHLRRARPDVNAWFVVRRGSPDWRRLHAGGERRLVAFGSLRWRLLLLNAAWLFSSDLDDAIVRPRAIRQLVPRPPWRFAFLRPGILTDEASAWLNRHRIDLLPVATRSELEAVAADGTRSRLTGKETRLTGLPVDGIDGATRLVAAVEELGRPWAGSASSGRG
jgi:glycosyltransferase involved in cell wall biosynthesis